MRNLLLLSLIIVFPLLAVANWNNPHSDEGSDQQVLFSAFSERPKVLDPIRSYSQTESVFTHQIYGAPLQYHFLKRPYELEPRLLTKLPDIIFYDENDNVISGDDVTKIAYSKYVLTLKQGVLYQPHPAFAKNESGDYLYHQLSEQKAKSYKTIAQFEQTDTRELVATDLLYQIKRFAHPRLHSPLSGLMQEHIAGMADLAKQLESIYDDDANAKVDLRDHSLSGVTTNGKYQLTIRINRVYPQFPYWLALPFFAPMPWEADALYGQAGMEENNLNLNWYPIGTGPYMLTENNPNLRIVLERNPNFYGETYPTEGEEGDLEKGLLDDAGKALPFIDKVIYTLEKESIPVWTKFLQGYYDRSGISSDSFDQAISYDSGNMDVSDSMREKKITLLTETDPASWYIGFNMLNKVVGGSSERARLLRQAIAITVNYEEYIEIFMNGRGEISHNPIPKGILGHLKGEAGINPYTHDWVNGKAQRKPLSMAKKLLAQAQYSNGIDQKTGKPLTLYFDNANTSLDGKARSNWLRKQFEKIGIQLVIRSTDFNRFYEKLDKGDTQMFFAGWGADYPDPENFLFLLYGPNSRVATGGVNYVNFSDPEFDRLFDKMKNMSNGPERTKIVADMVEIVRYQAPWGFAFSPQSFVLSHNWYKNGKLNLMEYGTLKYRRLESQSREEYRQTWNSPKLWPLILIALMLIAILVPAYLAYRKSEQQTGRH